MPLILLPIAIAAAMAPSPTMPRAEAVLSSTRRVADAQLRNATRYELIPAGRASVRNPLDWQQATFWVSLTDLADRDSRYAAPILELGRRTGWKLGANPYHADDQLIAQAWTWASRNGGGAAALAPTKAYLNNVLANRSRVGLEFVPRRPGSGDSGCTDRWCWCDALFMAPPTLLGAGATLRDPRLASFVHSEYRATKDYLYDPAERLFFRDSRFFERRDAKGRKLFWSRGNGWVLAGLARIIPQLPKGDPARKDYVELFRDMSARVVDLQKADGYWSPSLLDNGLETPRESSGTGFFTYALAWGVKAGILRDSRYRDAAIAGWAAMERSVRPDGVVGWVQQVSDRPDAVAPDDTQFYGTGAYILAGTAMYDLARTDRGARR